MEAGLQAALGSDDPASRSVEDGSQEAAAAAMSGGFHSGHRSLLLLPTNDPTAAATPQPRAGIRRGSTLLPFPLFRFCLAQFACGLFFWPSLLLPAWPVMCVISSFFTAQIFGILEIRNMWGPQISSSPNHRQGRRWIFKICAFFSLSLIWPFRFPSHLI